MTITLAHPDDAQPEGGPGDRTTAEPRMPALHKSRSIGVCFSYGWIALVILLAVFAPLLPLPSYSVPIAQPRLGPNLSSFGELLGTDMLGRSTLSRLVYGAQVSLVVVTVSSAIGFVLGTATGMLAGFLRRRVDATVSIVVDVLLAFPSLILLMALAAIFTPSFKTLLVGLALMAVPTFVRLARAHTITWSTRDFVLAARSLGAGNIRIMLKELLPNLLPALAAYLPIVMAGLMVTEGSLSFLGLGIPPPQPSWGGMINSGQTYLASYPLLVFIPATVIFLTVYSLNQIGDHLRTRYDRTLKD